MIEETDIRWQQRFEHYIQALDRLEEAIALSQDMSVSPEMRRLMREGLIQRFEFTQELAWKVMKDYELYQGYVDINGSRDALRMALEMGIITDARWMETIRDRNTTSHTYEEQSAAEIAEKIAFTYRDLFVAFRDKMKTYL